MLKRMSDAYSCDLEVYFCIYNIQAHTRTCTLARLLTHTDNSWATQFNDSVLVNKQSTHQNKTKNPLHKVQQFHGCIAITSIEEKNINSINAIEFSVLSFAHFAPPFMTTAQLKSMSSFFFFTKNPLAFRILGWSTIFIFTRHLIF